MVFEKTLDGSSKVLSIKWRKYINNFFKRFKNGTIGLDKLFSSKDAKEIIYKCYPLNPAVLAILPIISQKVAQNERTLYTFLTRDEDNSLYRFIKSTIVKDELRLLGFSSLYEYFSPLISKDMGIGGYYKIQLMYEEGCNKFDKKDVLVKEIISFVALISIVKDSNFCPISKDFIVATMSDFYSKEEIVKKIDALKNKRVIFFNKITNNYELMEGASIDIDEEIKKLKSKELTSKSLVKILKDYINPSYIIPNRYNFSHNIVRYFKGAMLSFEELIKIVCKIKT